MVNRITLGILGGAAAASGIMLARKWRNGGRPTLRQRIRRAAAGAMLVTASGVARWKTPRRLSKRIGLSLIGRSMAL